MKPVRIDGRSPVELRPVSLVRNFTKGPGGSVLVAFGDTRVLCTAIVEERVPPFLRDTGKGWVTAEYAMLPGSASEGRIPRSAANRGRAQEISRLIGRSLRAVTNLESLGERQITVDCDVLQADGGTRTASITGGFVALHDAVTRLAAKENLSGDFFSGHCAAVSLGIWKDAAYLDLNYVEDSSADVDLNLVMRDDGGIIEVQGSAEGECFDRRLLDQMMDMGDAGIRQLIEMQRECLRDG